MIKHVGKVGPGDPYFCLLLPCHTRLPLRGAVGIGGAEASRRRGASWDPAPQPPSAPSRTSGRSLWERASPAARQAPDGHQRARDRGAHGAICSAPRGARPRGRRRECQRPFSAPSPAPWSREGSPGDRAAFEGALLWNPEASCRDEAGDPDAVAVVLGTRPSHGIGDAAGTSGPWQSGSGSWAPRAAASCACARPLPGCSGSPACTRAGTLVSVPAPWSSSLA